MKGGLGIGPIEAGLQVIRRDPQLFRGVLGLWSGLGVTIVGSSPSVAIYFGMYTSVKAVLTERHLKKFPRYKLLVVAVSAAIGNSVASIFRVPYEVHFYSLCINYDSLGSKAACPSKSVSFCMGSFKIFLDSRRSLRTFSWR